MYLNVQSSSYLFLKKKGWIFVIFRKIIKRSSAVIVAIEADSKQEADEIFKKWRKKGNNEEQINAALTNSTNNRVDTAEWNLASFDNWEELNRSSACSSDFIIEKPDDEPRYDLYFFVGNERTYYYPGITMKRVAQELDYYDRTYKLTSASFLSHIDDIECPTENKIMVFEAVKRSED